VIVDGTGAPGRTAEIDMRWRVTEIGRLRSRARRVIDATGCLVTPGIVDVHTHDDGQATWDPVLAPSSWHGVTTLVIGNCGVGFAPVRPGNDAFLIEPMKGVEDIPGSALAEGMSRGWQSFAEYMTVLESQAVVRGIYDCPRIAAQGSGYRRAGAARGGAGLRHG
jgi:N-acyl-D-aspartate/D-glutamate deacylase